MEFVRALSLNSVLGKYLALMRACFPDATKFSEQYMSWLYLDNPSGTVVGFDAWDGDRLAAHYVCAPAVASVGGKACRALLSLNTATHPEYQGKGLFTKLAELTYAAGAEEGFECVYGVANANSTPGFVRKLGFQNVVSLEAKVGMGGLPASTRRTIREGGYSFRGIWNEERLRWRLSNPANPARAKRLTDGLLAIDAAATRSGLRAYGELPTEAGFETQQSPASFSPRLIIGLLPNGTSFGSYVSIPKALRPSPLNLIYRPLSGTVKTLEAESVYFTFFDFDAY